MSIFIIFLRGGVISSSFSGFSGGFSGRFATLSDTRLGGIVSPAVAETQTSKN